MEEKELYTELNQIFAAVLKKDKVELEPTTTAADISGWDSLTHMILMGSVEKHFSIKFKLMEIMKFANVGDMATCVQKKLANK